MRDLIQFSAADFGPNLIGMAIHGHADARSFELIQQIGAVVVNLLADGQEADLLGRKPKGEITREVFDQHAAESFHRTERRAVNHDRTMRLIVRADVAEVESHGEVVVNLHGAELPFSADDVADDKVDFWAVESGFAGLFGERDVEGLGGVATRCFGFVPDLGFAGVFIGVRVTEADAHAVVGHAEGGEHDLHECETADDFFGNLFFGAKEMGIVLGETAHASHAVKFPGLFPAVNRAELGEAQGQVAIGVRLGSEDLDVMGAIHRLQHEAVEELGRIHDLICTDGFTAGASIDFVGEMRGDGFEARSEFSAGAAFGRDAGEVVGLGDRGKLRLLVIGEVAGGFVEGKFPDMRGENLVIALFAELIADKVLQLLANHGAVGRPEDEALADVFVDDEEFEIFADLAVVAGAGLLDLVEVSGEFFLGGEGGAVDALELFVLLVAAVISTGDGEELEGFDLLAVTDVGAGTQVHELAVLVERDLFALGNVVEAAEFVGFLATGFDDFDGLLAGDLFAAKGLVLFDDHSHLGFDLFEIFGREFVVEIEIVIEAGVGGRTDIEFSLREEAENGGGQHVGARVANFFERSHHGQSDWGWWSGLRLPARERRK